MHAPATELILTDAALPKPKLVPARVMLTPPAIGQSATVEPETEPQPMDVIAVSVGAA